MASRAEEPEPAARASVLAREIEALLFQRQELVPAVSEGESRLFPPLRNTIQAAQTNSDRHGLGSPAGLTRARILDRSSSDPKEARPLATAPP
jgi:hypothetical protein